MYRARLMRWILLLALIARLAAVVLLDLVHPPFTGFEPWIPAWSLYHGHGFAFDWYGLLKSPAPSSFLPPLYSWILYVLLLLTGGSERATLLAVQGLQILLGTLTVLLVGRLGVLVASAGPAEVGKRPDPRTAADGSSRREPGFLRPVRRILSDPGLLAAGLWAVYPPALGHVAEARSQVLETLLLVLLAYLILRWWTRGSGSALGPGVTLGSLLLLRPTTGVVWAVWFVILLWNAGRRRQEVFRFFLISGLAAAVVIAPWTVRNYRLHHRLVPIATNGGFNFYLGNNPSGGGRVPSLRLFFERLSEDEREIWRSLPEFERDRRLYNLGLAFWKEQPGRALKGVAVRLQEFVFFRAWLFDAYPRWLSVSFAVSYLLLLIPFLFALPRCRGPACLLPVSAILVTGVVCLVYIVSMRFRATVEPFLAVIAGARGPGHRFARRDPRVEE